jgi:hypothetical protein
MAINSLSTGWRPGVCTFATRPTAPYAGQFIYQTDTNTAFIYNGSSFIEVALSTGVVSSLTGTANQVTVSASTGAITVSLPSAVSITGRMTANNGTSQVIDIGNWSSATYGAVNGNKGYLILSNSVGDERLYLRGGSATEVRIGGSGTDTLVVGNGSATVNGGFTASGVVTGSGGLVSNVFTTGVAYGSYGSVSLIGAGNNTYTGIANAYYSCAVMWNNTVFGHYRNNNTWNFYVESGALNCISINLSGGISAVGNVDIQNRYRGTAPNSGAYVQMRSGNAASWNWDGTYRNYVDSTLVKNFTIQHPQKPDNWLVHACAEGATADVFYRGESQLNSGICVVTLPDYFEELTELEGRSVMLTPIADENGMVANLAAYEIEDGQFLVEQIGGYHVPDQRFWWRVDAVRKNTPFNVEPLKSSVTVRGVGPYTYIESNS